MSEFWQLLAIAGAAGAVSALIVFYSRYRAEQRRRARRALERAESFEQWAARNHHRHVTLGAPALAAREPSPALRGTAAPKLSDTSPPPASLGVPVSSPVYYDDPFRHQTWALAGLSSSSCGDSGSDAGSSCGSSGGD